VPKPSAHSLRFRPADSCASFSQFASRIIGRSCTLVKRPSKDQIRMRWNFEITAPLARYKDGTTRTCFLAFLWVLTGLTRATGALYFVIDPAGYYPFTAVTRGSNPVGGAKIDADLNRWGCADGHSFGRCKLQKILIRSNRLRVQTNRDEALMAAGANVASAKV
jgi:hypothetical protein